MAVVQSSLCFVVPVITIIAGGGLTPETYVDSLYLSTSVVLIALMQALFSSTLIVAILMDQFKAREEQTFVDPLTGMQSRRPFEEHAVKMLDRARTRSTPVCVIVADIDHFKHVYDLWGHQAGDKAIGAFGNLVAKMVRDSDLAGRIGGEEFCILAWDCNISQAEGLAGRIRQSFAKLQHYGINSDVRLTASFGVAAWIPGEGYGKVFARADAALYQAKNSGRNRVCLPTSDTSIAEATPSDIPDRRAAAS